MVNEKNDLPDYHRLPPNDDDAESEVRQVRQPSHTFLRMTCVAAVIITAMGAWPGAFTCGLICPLINFFILFVALVCWFGLGVRALIRSTSP